MGQALKPPRAPILAEDAAQFFAQARFDGRNYLRNAIVILVDGRDVLVKVTRPRRAAAQGVDLRAGKAVEGVELHGRQRLAELDELRRRIVELTALVVGADDEHAHVEAVRGLDGTAS